MIDLSIKINDESLRGHLDRDLANTAVAALTNNTEENEKQWVF